MSSDWRFFGEGGSGGGGSLAADTPVYACEAFIPGNFVKFTNNAGAVVVADAHGPYPRRVECFGDGSGLIVPSICPFSNSEPL